MRLGRTAAVAVVGMAVLAGCSDTGTANETLPPVSSSAAPTNEALQPLGPADFPMPTEARELTESGALAAGRYFAQLTQHTLQKMDPSGFTELSRDCRFCDDLVKAVQDDAAAGNRYSGGQIAFRDQGQTVLRGNTAEVAFSLTQGALDVIGPNGNPIVDRSQPSSDVFSSFTMTWDPEGRAWLLNQLTNS